MVPSLSINYRSLLFRYRKNWYWFVLALVTFLVLAYLHLRYAVPQYTTTGTFIIEDPLDSDGVSARNFTQQLGYYDEQSIEDELNIVRSRTLMAQAVRNLGLNLQIVHQGKIRDTDLYRPGNFTVERIDSLAKADDEIVYGSTELFGHSFRDLHLVQDGDTIAYTMGEPFRMGNQFFSFLPTAAAELDRESEEVFTYRLRYRDPIDVAGGMVGRLSVRAQGQSNTVKMTYTDSDPDRAADVVNELIQVYNDKTIRERSLTGEQTVDFIDSRLNYVSRQLNSVESSVAGLRQRQGMILEQSVRGADVLAQLNEADAQLAELEVRKALIEDLRNNLNATDEYRPLTVSSEIVESSMASLIGQYNQLIFEREQNLEVATAENPVVFTYDERLSNLRQTLRRSVETIFRETSERATRIKERVKPLEERMNRMPEDERRLVQVLREQKIREGLFVYLMQKREEAALTVAAQIPNTRVVDPARPSRRPISPKPTQTYLLAIGMALLLPGMGVFMREALDTKLQLEKDITDAVGLPLLGRIAKSSKKTSIVVSRENRSGVAEMFRLLRTNLSFLMPQGRATVMLLTSSVSGEGKTFVSANLGYSLALGSKRTVIIGADLRKPRLSSVILDQKKEEVGAAGLSSYLVGEANYEDIIQATDNDKLFYVQSGPIPPNPSELLLRKELGELIRRLKEDFDVIIIDSPPVGLVTDALLFQEFVDITLYVVRLGYTPKASLEVVNDLAFKDKMPNIGIVVNGLEPSRDYGYGYAQGYYK